MKKNYDTIRLILLPLWQFFLPLSLLLEKFSWRLTIKTDLWNKTSSFSCSRFFGASVFNNSLLKIRKKFFCFWRILSNIGDFKVIVWHNLWKKNCSARIEPETFSSVLPILIHSITLKCSAIEPPFRLNSSIRNFSEDHLRKNFFLLFVLFWDARSDFFDQLIWWQAKRFRQRHQGELKLTWAQWLAFSLLTQGPWVRILALPSFSTPLPSTA